MEEIRIMKKTAKVIGFAMLLYMVALIAVEFAAVFLGEMIAMVMAMSGGADYMEAMDSAMKFIQNGWFVTISTVVSTYVVAPISAWLVLRKLPNGTFTKGRLSVGKVLMCGCVSMGTMYLFGYLSEGILWITAKIFNTSADSLNAVSQMGGELSTLQYVLMLCVFAPIVEEVVFRGLIIKKMLVHGELAALVVSAFVFGMVHGTLSQIPYALAVGLVFGYIYIRFGNIYLNIGVHAFLNFLGGVIAMFLGDVNYGDYISLGISFAFIIAAIIILIVKGKEIRINTTENTDGMTAGQQIKAVFLNPGMICYSVVCVLMMIFTTISIVAAQYVV